MRLGRMRLGLTEGKQALERTVMHMGNTCKRLKGNRKHYMDLVWGHHPTRLRETMQNRSSPSRSTTVPPRTAKVPTMTFLPFHYPHGADHSPATPHSALQTSRPRVGSRSHRLRVTGKGQQRGRRCRERCLRGCGVM